MKIKFLGHASFLITSQDQKKIITDPYTVGHGLSYGAIHESADIVTISHGHGDHNNAKSIMGHPTIIQTAGQQTVLGIDVKSMAVYHDESQGSQRGPNLVFCFQVDGLNICHMGDLGHRLTQQQISSIGPVDILMVPVGGFFTLSVKDVTEVVRAIKPKVTIPMHFKTPQTDYPIGTVEEFLKGQKNIRRLNSSEIEFIRDTLPQVTEIILLEPAL